MTEVEVHWCEDELIPATAAEMRDGMREAMVTFISLLPGTDDCQCLTCRAFRHWLEEPLTGP